MAKRGRPVSVMGEDEVLVVYKHRSLGEVLGVHNSISELAKLEDLYRSTKTSSANIHHTIRGKSKFFSSFHYRCKVVVRIRKLKNNST